MVKLKAVPLLKLAAVAWVMGIGVGLTYHFFDYQLNGANFSIWAWPNLFLDFIPLMAIGGALTLHYAVKAYREMTRED